MRVMVTGHCGNIGTTVTEQLRGLGYVVAGFDIAEGSNLLDLEAVKRSAAGCTAVVHLGAIPNDSGGKPEDIMAVNVLGTWHVLLAAEEAAVERVVYFSSAQVFGVAENERFPDYFPVDDAHPRRAMRPYGLSKKLGEDLCEGFTARTGIATISLRPVLVLRPEDYGRIVKKWNADPRSEWEPYWEWGAVVDVRDVADAVAKALTTPLYGHHRAILCAADISGSAPSLELAARLAPDVPVRNKADYSADPWRALFDSAVAENLLGWRPRYRWSDEGNPAEG
ncbi:MAG TPA: NAD(P)-dependent oxidoreductase [Acidimicrobiales bacterium]|nr:NAD(P)-dependent oxidoreductase [Acidimicrobiales bacterium]